MVHHGTVPSSDTVTNWVHCTFHKFQATLLTADLFTRPPPDSSAGTMRKYFLISDGSKKRYVERRLPLCPPVNRLSLAVHRFSCRYQANRLPQQSCCNTVISVSTTSTPHPRFIFVQLELVLFDDALRHLLRLNRLIEMPRGSALLVGVGGSGKQSLTRLASYISRAVCFQITLTKTYNINSFMEDLR